MYTYVALKYTFNLAVVKTLDLAVVCAKNCDVHFYISILLFCVVLDLRSHAKVEGHIQSKENLPMYRYMHIQVKMIPQIFHSTEDYLESYKEPLIEETRSNVLSSLNGIHRCQRYKLLSITEGEDFKYLLDIDPSCEDGVPYAARNDDLFLLSTYDTDDSLVKNDGIFALALDITPHGYFRKSFHVMTKGDIRSTNFKYAIFLCNITSNVRVWKSLQFKVEDNSVIKEILKPAFVCSQPFIY